MEETRCTATRLDTEPCQARAMPGSTLCWAHHPDVQAKRKDGQRRGGHARSTAARAARQWAAIGRDLPDEDLPAVVKALVFAVRDGTVDPGIANCIAGLAKTALALHGDLEVERRLQALEEAAAVNRPSSNVRRLA